MIHKNLEEFLPSIGLHVGALILAERRNNLHEYYMALCAIEKLAVDHKNRVARRTIIDPAMEEFDDDEL